MDVVKGVVNGVVLEAPESYWRMSVEYRNRMTNGCGPGGWKYDLVPDTIWGLDVHDACDIHDWCYFIGKTESDKQESDDMFLRNLNTIIMAKTDLAITRRLRMRRARKYHWFVVHCGHDAFWEITEDTP